MLRISAALLVLFVSLTPFAHAQDASPMPDAPLPGSEEATVANLRRNILHDQAAIWTSPFRMSGGSMVGGLVFVAVAGAVGAEDRHIMQSRFLDANTNKHANTVSTGLTGLFVAAPVALYSLGGLGHSEHAQETGILGGEAIVDSLAVNEVFKIASRRERPTVDGAKGKFFQPGVNFDSAFASNHSAIAWSSATVIAEQYDGWMTKVTAYGLASAVSVSRVVGRDHFPSDVLVGSAVGYMIGRYVQHRHHREDAQ